MAARDDAVEGSRRNSCDDAHPDDRGAYTGETSPLMLGSVASFVILGHSERRQYDGETDESVGRKVASAVA